MKKLFLLLVLTTLIGCGFKPIYSSDKTNFKIVKIEAEKNLLNKRFSEKLKAFSNENSNNKFVIKFNIEKNKYIKAKNKRNIPSIFELEIDLKLTIIDQSDNTKSKRMSLKTTYDNNEDKFKLRKYEEELENTLINQLILDVIDFLSNEK